MRSLLPTLLLLALSMPAMAQPPSAELANGCYSMGRLLDPAGPAAEREEHLAMLQAAAELNRPRALHLLGSLYRLGETHPSKLLPQDDAQARGFLSRAALGGELLAMAGLAEIELNAGNAMEGMVWAQVMIAYAERHDVNLGGEAREYPADLVLRAYDAIGQGRSRAVNQEIQEYVNGFVATYGERIDAALRARASAEESLDGPPDCSPSYDYDRWPLSLEPGYQRPRVARSPAARKMTRSGSGLFYVDVEPDGSVSRVLTIDALPNAAYGPGLQATVERLRFNAIEGAPVRGAIVPMSLNTGQVMLKD